jgi:cytochrome c-type biogenesis protein CcmH
VVVVAFVLVALAVAAGLNFVAQTHGALSTDVRARQIGLKLACPVCQGLSVADSPSQLATQMRGVIRQKIEAGESDGQIMRYFEDAYGESILLDPPRQGFWLLIWIAPLALVLCGGLVVVYVARGLVSRATTQVEQYALDIPDERLDAYKARVEAEEVSA